MQRMARDGDLGRRRTARCRRAGSSAPTARCGRTSGCPGARCASSRCRPSNGRCAKIGGGQSGSTTSFMNASRSSSYSEKSPTCPLRGSDERALGQALPAPVEGGDGKAARAQLAHGLEIFLDEFGAALEQAHRALAARRRMPARKAQGHAVARLERAGDHVFGHRIGGDGNEIHALARSGLDLMGRRSKPARLIACAGERGSIVRSQQRVAQSQFQ